MPGPSVPPVGKTGTNSVRAEIRAKRQPEISRLAQMGLDFLQRYKTQNVIPLTEFQKFIPLFNKAQFASMDDATRRDLYYEWTQRIDIQHAVYVINPSELDEEKGVRWEHDGKKHKVVYALPPKVRRLHPINRLGGNITALAAEFLANAQSSSNPFDNKGTYYSSELGKVVKMANSDSMKKQDSDFKKLNDRTMATIKPDSAKIAAEIAKPLDTQKDTDNPSGIDAEWE